MNDYVVGMNGADALEDDDDPSKAMDEEETHEEETDDEEMDDDDEEEEESDDDDNDVMLELLATRIPDGVPSLQSNNRAIQLARFLVGNKTMASLELFLSFDCTSNSARALAEGISGSQIQTLTLASSFELPSEIAQLGGAKALKALALRFPLGNDFVVKFSESLRTSQLLSLDLVGCGISDTHMCALSCILGNHQSIGALNVHKNQIGDAGVASFIENWSQESLLSYLHLGYNKISAHGAVLLMKALPDHPTLSMVRLNGNKAIGYDGIKMIGDCLFGTMLDELDLNDTAEWIDFDDQTCEAAVLQHAKYIQAGKALLEGVRRNVQLRLLRFHELRLSSEIKSEIQEYVVANECGRRHLQLQHHLPPAAWSYFLAKRQFSNNTSVMFLLLRELPCLMMACGSDGGNR